MTALAVIEKPPAELLATDGLIGEAKALVIADQASYDRAGELLLLAAERIKGIVEYHKPKKAAAHGVWKDWCNQETQALEPWEAIRGQVGPRRAQFEREQDRKAREEQERLRREAEEREREQNLAAAIQAEQQGASPEEVAAVLDAPVVAPPVMRPVPAFQPTRGISNREYWVASVKNLETLILATARDILQRRGVSPVILNQVATEAAPIACLVPDMTVLNNMARSLKKTFRIPGVEATCRADSSVRTR